MFKRRIASFVVITTGLIVASPAMADWQQIVNLHSGLCLGVTGGIMQSGESLIQWPCNGNPDQTWMVPTSSTVTQIQNMADPSYCLSVVDSSEGSQLAIQPCGGSSYGTAWEEWWDVNYFSQGGDNAWVLTQWLDGYVAADAAANSGPGAIIQWQNQITGAFSHTEQQWLFEQPNVTFHFTSAPAVGGQSGSAGGNITFYSNGTYSVSGGEFTADDKNLAYTYTFFVGCPSPVGPLGIDWSWSGTVNGNAFQYPTAALTGNGNSPVVQADWTNIKNVWQQSSQLTCFLSITKQSVFSGGGADGQGSFELVGDNWDN